MSEENVDLVRRLLATFRDELDLDAASAFWDPEIEWRAIEGAPDDIGVMKGEAALRRYYEQWTEILDDMRVTVEEVLATDEGAVAYIGVTGRMKGSDAELGMKFAIVYTVSGGKVVRGREYATREEALAAAGLA